MLEFFAMLATLIAILISPISKYFDDRAPAADLPHGPSPPKKTFGFTLRKRSSKSNSRRAATPAGTKILLLFSVFVALLGATTVAAQWNYLVTHGAELLHFVWLVTVMVFGMFAQVLELNVREGRSWYQLTATELLLPTLFSIVVFYPIWSSVASGPHGYFSFYSAFLNGYFWKTIVASATPLARKPVPPPPGAAL